MASLGTAYVDIKPDWNRFNRGLRSEMGSSRWNSMGAQAGKSFSRGLGRAAKIGAAAAFAGVAVETKRVVAAWREAEKVGRQTDAVLRSTGGSANVTAKHVERLANSISLKAGIDDEAIQSAENLLLTFTNLRNETGKGNAIFDRATQAVTDMSVALKQDLKSSSIQVGKALNDPVKGLTALQRVGVSFTKDQKAMVEQWVEQGDTLKAQRFILKELEKEFGGSAAAQADAFDKLKVAGENLEESLGELIGPALSKAANGLATFIDKTRAGEGGVARFIEQIRNSEGVGGRLRIWVEGAVNGLARFVNEVRTGTGVGGQFRTVVTNIATTLYSFGAALAPVVTGLGGLALKVGGLALDFASSETAVVLLSAALGGLLGRAAALGTIWAVGKVAAFASAIGSLVTTVRTAIAVTTSLRGAMVLLSASMATNPIGLLAIALGTLAGAAYALTQRQKDQKVSSDSLRDSLRQQRDAAIALRDTDLELADAKNRNRGANLAVERAEQTLRQARKQYGKDSLEAREAEQRLREARTEQKRAARELGDQEERTRRKREDLSSASRKAVGDHRKTVSALRSEVEQMRELRDSHDPLERKMFETRGGAEALRKKERELEKAQKGLNTALNQMPGRKKTTVDVTIDIKGVGSKAEQALQNFGGGPTGGSSGAGVGPNQGPKDILNAVYDASVQNSVQRWVDENKDKLVMLGGGDLGKAGQMGAITQIARRFGLVVTSGFRRGDPGWHGRNRARDYAGGNMLAFARYMAQHYGRKLLELIHTPLGFGIKNGQRVPPYAAADHYDHVHVAYRKGGTFGDPKRMTARQTAVVAGEDAPRHPEYFIPTNPRYRDRAAGLLAQAADEMKLRMAFFAKGGVMGASWDPNALKRSRNMSGREIYGYAVRGGFRPGREARIAAAIALAESSGSRLAHNTRGEDSRGLWQINVGPGANTDMRRYDLFRPLQNAKAAYQIFRRQGWNAWTMFTNGRYRSHLDEVGPGRGSGSGGGSTASQPKPDPLTGPRPLGTPNLIADLDRQIASPFNPTGTSTAAGSDLNLQREKKRLQRARITRLENRLRAIDRRLKRRIPKSERTRLLKERQEIVSELSSLYGEYGSTLDAIRELKNPPPAEVPEDPAWAGIGARQAMAELTSSTADDLSAAEEGARQATLDYFWALQGGDPARITEAAGRLKEWGDRLTGLRNPEQAAAEAVDATASNTEALNALRDELRKQNEIMQSVIGISSREAIRALADNISGEIVGHGIAPRRAVAGAGSVVSY